jgi:hypothetical protein
MKGVFLIVFAFNAMFSFGQTNSYISAIDFVKIKNEKRKEALFFYENNWKVYRDIALEKGFIKSYKLLAIPSDTISNFDLILVTEYADSTQLKLSEERFQGIIKAIRPTGPKLLNELKPNDFRQNLFFRQAQTIFDSEVNRKQKKKR